MICTRNLPHLGAHKLQLEIARHRENIAVVGVPKTIDNDIGLIDRSFGFNTAVEEAAASDVSCRQAAGENGSSRQLFAPGPSSAMAPGERRAAASGSSAL